MDQAYEGAALFSGSADGRASGVVRVTSVAVCFEAAEARVELPLEGLRLRLGGANDRLIFFSSASQPDWSVYTSDHSILANPLLVSHGAIAEQIGRVRTSKWRARAVTGGVLASLLLAIVAVLSAKDVVVGSIAAQVPPEVEVALGEAAFSHLETQHTLLDLPELRTPLARMTDPLAGVVPQHGYPFVFHVVEDESVNAFALPGGHVVIHSGLLLRAGSAEEVVGVLAHEIAHVTRRHSLRQIISSAGVFLLVQAFLGDLTGLTAVLTEGGAELLSLSYSREFELEADETGWGYLLAAGVDPGGMLSFFERLRQEEQRPNVVAAAGGFDWLSTHPSTQERIDRLAEKLQEIPRGARYSTIDVDLTALQALVRHHSTPILEGDVADGSQD